MKVGERPLAGLRAARQTAPRRAPLLATPLTIRITLPTIGIIF